MSAQKTAIIFIQGQTAEDTEIIEYVKKELQNRSIHDICLILPDDYGAQKTSREQAQAIMKILDAKACIPAQQQEDVYSKEDEEKIKKRLEDLGYL